MLVVGLFYLGCGGVSTSGHDPDIGAKRDLAVGNSQDLGGSSDLANQVANDLATSGSGDLATSQGPSVGLTFSGCSPNFSGPLVAAAGNGSMVIASQTAPAQGEVQLHLTETSGTIVLSTMEREQTGDVVNVIAGSTWTNTRTSWGGSDPISGTITIHAYDEDTAKCDLTFHAVTLQNIEDNSICQVDGTLVSTGSSF